MTTTPPTFARQDKLKFFRTLNSTITSRKTISKKELETSFENHYPDHFFLHLTSILTLDMPSGFIVDDSYGHRYGWCRYECYA
jgi:hypothetical protein